MRFSSIVIITLMAPSSLLAVGDFFDNFDRADGEPGADWVTTMGTAQISANQLLLESPGTEGWTWIDTVSFSGDITFQFDIQFDPADASPDVGRHGGVMFMTSEKTNRYSPGMNGYTVDWIDRSTDQGYRFHKWTAGTETLLLPDRSAPDADPGTTWRITVTGDTMTLDVDGVQKLQVEGESELRQGSIGFWGWSNGQHMHIDNVFVGEPPTARIVATPPSGKAPLDVQFDGSMSTTPVGSISSYSWSFGDGQTATGDKVTHSYPDIGVYRARLTVTDSRGVAAAATVSIQALFSSGDVSPWISADVGAPVLAGGARLDGQCLAILGGGKEISRSADSFHFVYQEKSGDLSITARIQAATWPTSARAGLMFRSTLDADSMMAMSGAFPLSTRTLPLFLSRLSAGDAARLRSGALEVNPPNAYIRLERKGVELIGSASSDGQSWTEISRATLNAPPDKMLVGFAVNGADKQDTGVFSLLTFCDIVLTGSVPAPNPPKGLTAAPADQKVDLSWGDPDPGPEFTGFAVLRDGNKIATVPATQKAYSDGGLVNGTQHCYTVRAVNGSAESADSGQACATPSPAGAIFHRGDSDDNGQLQLTDAVRILGFLFLGGIAPTCLDAADSDNNGQLQLTDAVRILGFLFLGGLAPAAPGPPGSPCGVDSDASLGCASYTKC